MAAMTLICERCYQHAATTDALIERWGLWIPVCAACATAMAVPPPVATRPLSS
jgi:hypothetical protein